MKALDSLVQQIAFSAPSILCVIHEYATVRFATALRRMLYIMLPVVVHSVFRLVCHPMRYVLPRYAMPRSVRSEKGYDAGVYGL